MEIFKVICFEAAHRLPHVPAGHKCGRLHGHSFRAEIHVAGTPDPATGWVMDFADIKLACAPVLEALDHNYLNSVEGLENPTSEEIARWMWRRLRPALPRLSRIVLHETCTAGCAYSGEDERA
ncbi:MAG: 6-carboxytetrahydropterin synthase QueD [Planctomycetes bacterium]|nr:6-carboxytetrahydropterin synthase QueD [Planctomycetota bacterium]